MNDYVLHHVSPGGYSYWEEHASLEEAMGAAYRVWMYADATIIDVWDKKTGRRYSPGECLDFWSGRLQL